MSDVDRNKSLQASEAEINPFDKAPKQLADIAAPPPPPKVQESVIDAVGKIDIAAMQEQMDMFFLNNPGTRLFGNQYLLPAAFKESSLPHVSEQALQRKIIANLGAVRLQRNDSLRGGILDGKTITSAYEVVPNEQIAEKADWMSDSGIRSSLAIIQKMHPGKQVIPAYYPATAVGGTFRVEIKVLE
ncbi:MAG: hypothetical protein ACOCXT_01075 [Candidatus Dojkabacteria bacterium]